MQTNQEQKNSETNDPTLNEIIAKIQGADSILIALSQNPSVDELATAMGLGMFIDKMGKHATAIYSGTTPNALKFLNPERQFETNTNGLQDFIIAINKEKADHLRYKLDGDYVKVYITPYRTTISENDLEFSHGDYNVNLVIALNVESADRLDQALGEHGRIMHDATIINIAAGVSGKFGEIQWSNPAASSVAEMAAGLITAMKDNAEIDKEIATAILTGIVAATERFSNNRTQPETMAIASQLMAAGADQQLISANIIKEEAPKTFEIERDEQASVEQLKEETPVVDNTILDVQAAKAEETETEAKSQVDEVLADLSARVEPPKIETANPVLPTVDDTLEKTEEVISVPDGNREANQPKVADPASEFELPTVSQSEIPSASAFEAPVLNSDILGELKQMSEPKAEVQEEKPIETVAATTSPLGKDYGSMIDEALAEADTTKSSNSSGGYIGSNPALSAAPGVADEPEEGNIPSLSFDRPVDMSEEKTAEGNDSYINETPMKTLEPKPEGLPMPNEDILPPPPAPPVDFSMSELPKVEEPVVQTENKVEENNGTVEPLVSPIGAQTEKSPEPDNNPSAFKIPGM